MRALANQEALTLRIFAVSAGVNVSVTGASVEDIGVIRAPARTWSPDASETNSAVKDNGRDGMVTLLRMKPTRRWPPKRPAAYASKWPAQLSAILEEI
jgi:hypothetical protein